MTKPVVSVVMSVYNGETYLREAVDSVLCQSVNELEFVIVDDGSTDRTAEILERVSASDARVVVLTQVNSGLVASLNTGCALAKGKYLARMDADDISLPDRLKDQIEYLEKNPQVAVVGGRVLCIDALGRSLPAEPLVSGSGQVRGALNDGSCVITHPAVVMRKSVFDEVGGYRRALIDAEDYDLWLRISEHYELDNMDKAVLKYRRHSNQISIKKFRQQAISNLAARAAAQARRSGLADPLSGLEPVTDQTLALLGISEIARLGIVTRAYITSIGNLAEAGKVDDAWSLVREMRSELSVGDLPSNLACDFHLLEARLLRKQGEFGKSLRELWRAVAVQPTVVARPFKPIVRATNRR